MLFTREWSEIKRYSNVEKVWKKLYHVNTNQNKSSIAMLILDIICFKAKSNIRYKDYFWMIQSLIRGKMQLY